MKRVLGGCCVAWQVFSPEARTWPWQVLHQLGHSRVTFSVPTLMELARVDADEAHELIRDAIHLGWIAAAAQSMGIYVGRLPTTPRREPS